MSSTAKRFAGPALLTNAAATKYTVPASTVSVLKYFQVENPTASPVTFTMSIGADAAGTRIYDAFTIPANSVLSVFCYYVLNATEVIQAFAGTTNEMTLTLNGVELTPG